MESLNIAQSYLSDIKSEFIRGRQLDQTNNPLELKNDDVKTLSHDLSTAPIKIDENTPRVYAGEKRKRCKFY